MKPRITLLTLLVVAAGLCVFAVTSARREAARQAALQKAQAARAAALAQAPVPRVFTPPLPEPAPPDPEVRPAAKTPPAQPAKVSVKPPITAPVAAQAAPAPGGKKPWVDPLAREALGMVGLDPQAEVVWLLAINNPDLPPNERQDLIEDLNEDGFPDPKNITLNDLPLILSRLEVIEACAAGAMDEVNAEAFMEAYKDLVNMVAQLGQQ